MSDAEEQTLRNVLNGVSLVLGVGVFLFAMWWDGSDRRRETRRSDVAFWLHLLAAPLIVHPIFTLLGLTEGAATLVGGVTVILLYVVLGITALAVDRRALARLGARLCALRDQQPVPDLWRGRAELRADRLGHRLGAAAALGLLDQCAAAGGDAAAGGAAGAAAGRWTGRLCAQPAS